MRIAIAGATGVVGRYVVEVAEAAGHDVVPMSRSAGVDTLSGEGLEEALVGVDVVVDVSSPGVRDDALDQAFFRDSTANLHRLGLAAGVGHLVVLSIVGIDGAETGHPAAKLVQEEAALSGPLTVSILRATQFHEFPAQSIGWTSDGVTAKVAHSRVQTVAARTVGEALVELAEGFPLGRAPDLAGTEEADLFELAQRFAGHMRLDLELVATEDPSPARSRLPGAGARLAGPTFDQWLTSPDAGRMVAAASGGRRAV